MYWEIAIAVILGIGILTLVLDARAKRAARKTGYRSTAPREERNVDNHLH